MNFSKSECFRYSLVFLIILTCITDIASFFWSGLYEYEINPLVIFLKSSIGIHWAVALAVVVKAAMVLAIAQWVYSYKTKLNKTHTWAYLTVYMGILIILVQGFGTYANITTTIAFAADPVNTVPMPIEQTVKVLNIVNIIYYCVTFLSLFSFWIYEKIYRITPKTSI